MITLRPYQAEALQKVMEALRRQSNVLLQASTGAGKTILFSALIRTYLEQYHGRVRILVLAHREELVRQAYDKLLRVWPEGEELIDIACSGVKAKVDYSKPVIIGTIQTVAKRLDNIQAVHLVIVDEVHRLPPRVPDDAPQSVKRNQYQRVIQAMLQVYPKMRVFGVTATPYRLGHGNIYGDKCAHPEANWFPDLTYAIDIDTLQKQGFLCPSEYLVPSEVNLDLSGIDTSKGEFDERQLGELMTKAIHIQTAVDSFVRYAQDRMHVVIFAVNIQHAQLLRKAFNESALGKCGIVHSNMKKEDRRDNLEAFQRGELRFLVNVAVLTEGWDAPATDCILLCRPTMSAALYVQMVGRGLRIADGKENCIVLDLANNYKTNGDIRNPRVRIGKGATVEELVECDWCHKYNDPKRKTCKYCGRPLWEEESEEEEEEGAGERICPFCGFSNSPTDIICAQCKKYIRDVASLAPDMKRIESNRRVRARICSKPVPNFGFISKNSHNHMIRLHLVAEPIETENTLPFNVNVFWDIEGNGSPYGRSKARLDWMKLSGSTRVPPSTIDEARERWDELEFPSVVTLVRKGQYWNVERWSA